MTDFLGWPGWTGVSAILQIILFCIAIKIISRLKKGVAVFNWEGEEKRKRTW